MHFVLASSSAYRQSLLQKLRIPFTSRSPAIDETPKSDETAEQLVRRLAQQKAQAVFADYKDAWIIASDQVACFNNQIIGKPHTTDNAIRQLSGFSGNTVKFLTSLCIYRASSGQMAIDIEPFEVTFKDLPENQIKKYIQLEQPLNCAGSFKSEGLGILLFERLNGRDPNALVGLPIILLRELFQRFNLELLDYSK